VPELEYQLDRGAGGFDCLVVDMSGLTFLDSSGVRFLLELKARSEHDRSMLRIVPGPLQVRRGLEIAGVAELLPWWASLPLREWRPPFAPPSDG
jgi:anti-anti-sigma factor